MTRPKTPRTRYTDFECPTCGWAWTHHCVVGTKGSAKWLEQIPRAQWHPSRHNELKRRKAEQQTK